MKLKIQELFKLSQEGQSVGHGNTSHPMAVATVTGSHQQVQQAVAIQQALAGRSPASSRPHPAQQLSGVKLKRLPFYCVQGELLQPMALVAGGSGRFQEAQFQFLLTAQQATVIASNRDISPGSKLEYPYQVCPQLLPYTVW